MTYIRKHNNKTKKFYDLELRIIEALRNKLNAGDGWTRIKMKDDGQDLDISDTVDGKFLVTFPPYYDATKGQYKNLNRWFDSLDDVAVFILNKEWQVRW